MLFAWGKHQIVDINILAFSWPKLLWYTQNSQCIKNSIFPSGKHVLPISLILKLEVMGDLILYMLSFKREHPYFMKIAYFPFKSEYKFSQFPHRFKIGIFSVLVLALYFQVLPN